MALPERVGLHTVKQNMDFDSDAFKSNLQRAVESNDPEAIGALNKSETVFYLCALFEVEPPAEHPTEHNGTVPRSLSQKWAQILGDYIERNGRDALHTEEILAAMGGESDDSDDGESDESDESDDEGGN